MARKKGGELGNYSFRWKICFRSSFLPRITNLKKIKVAEINCIEKI